MIGEMVVDIKNWFNTLDPDIRSKFNNDAISCQEWLLNKDNKEEAQELGLIPKPVTAKYIDKDGNDITSEVIETRGLYRNGIRVNKDGTPYLEVVAPTPPVE